jgi:hypothetical protein
MISHERLDHPANHALQAREVSQEAIYAGELSHLRAKESLPATSLLPAPPRLS